MYVGEMPNGVSQLERIVLGAAEGDGLFVQRSGRSAAAQVTLDLPKTLERLDQIRRRVRLTRESDRFQESRCASSKRPLRLACAACR